MSKLVVPVTGKILWATGDLRLWVDLDLYLKDNGGGWNKETFRVDAATDISTFPAYVAKQLDLPLPVKAASSIRHQPTGLEIRSGILRFRIAGMDATEYSVPTLFLGDPSMPPGPGQFSSPPRKLLQPLALLDKLRFVLDRDISTGSPYGELTLEKK